MERLIWRQPVRKGGNDFVSVVIVLLNLIVRAVVGVRSLPVAGGVEAINVSAR